jgi:hypothetical protein
MGGRSRPAKADPVALDALLSECPFERFGVALDPAAEAAGRSQQERPISHVKPGREI